MLQTVLSLAPGGTERLVIDIVERSSPDVECFVCCLDARGEWGRRLAATGVVVEELNRGPGFRPDVVTRLSRVIAEHRIDVLHCHHYTPFVYGQAAASLRGARVVFTEHGRLSDAPPSRKRRFVNPLLGRLPSAICAVSADLKRHMAAEGLPAHRIQIVYNGIRLAPPAAGEQRSAARRVLGLDDTTAVIGSVGRLDPVKDFGTLIQAVAAIRARGQAAKLVILGSGDELPHLQSVIAAAGLQSAALLPGYRDDVTALLPAFDIFANSSVHEGVSLTILEAMAASLPVVATTVGGTPEVVTHDDTGLLVPSRDPAALAGALEALLTNPSRRLALGRAGRAVVETRFTSERMIDEYVRLYRGA